MRVAVAAATVTIGDGVVADVERAGATGSRQNADKATVTAPRPTVTIGGGVVADVERAGAIGIRQKAGKVIVTAPRPTVIRATVDKADAGRAIAHKATVAATSIQIPRRANFRPPWSAIRPRAK